MASCGLAAGPVPGGALVSIGWRAIFRMKLLVCPVTVPLVLAPALLIGACLAG